MAATATMVDSRLSLIFSDGVDGITGKELFKTKSFNNVKVTATADQLYAVSTSLAPLQERSLFKVERDDSSELRQA